MGNALLWNVWKLNIGKNGGFLYCFVFYICFVCYSTENTVSLVEKYTRPKKSFFFSTDHLFWNSDSYWYLGSQVWEAKPKIVEAFNGVLTTSWYEREVVLLGILVMLLGSNLKSLVPYKCSAQSPAFAGGLVQSAWFADVTRETLASLTSVQKLSSSSKMVLLTPSHVLCLPLGGHPLPSFVFALCV